MKTMVMVLASIGLGSAARAETPNIPFDRVFAIQVDSFGSAFCVEGGSVNGNEGRTVLQRCAGNTGMYWRLSAAGRPGFYNLKNDNLGESFCLEGERIGGHALMTTCGFSGQEWNFEPVPNIDGRIKYRLSNAFFGTRVCLSARSLFSTGAASASSGKLYLKPCESTPTPEETFTFPAW